MKFATLIIATTLAATPAAVLADPQTAPAVPAAATKSAPGGEKLICRNEEVIGSRIATKRVCLTADRWRERQFQAGQWAEHQQTYNSILR